MSGLPVIKTSRLVLRPFCQSDAPDVQRLAGNRQVAATTAAIPHPYRDGLAESWIATHEAGWELGRGLVCAITLASTGELVGAIGLSITPEHRSADLGYWLGVPYWGRGLCTEAAQALIAHAFRKLGLNRISAHHFVRNGASGRVLEKCGMRVEGIQREAFIKWGQAQDLRRLAILRNEWESVAPGG